jgi:hypothetical protein
MNIGTMDLFDTLLPSTGTFKHLALPMLNFHVLDPIAVNCFCHISNTYSVGEKIHVR